MGHKTKSDVAFASGGDHLGIQSQRNGADKPCALEPKPRQSLLEDLRGQIRKIERSPILLSAAPEPIEGQEKSEGRPASDASAWTLGAPEIDALIGAEGLDKAGMHEIKPMASEAGSWAASAATAFRFALALA